MTENSWSSLHIYVHGGLDYTDDFLAHRLAPAAEQLVADGDATSWFFMRYWTGGPHIRLRLRDADPERVQKLAAELQTWLVQNPPADSPLAPAAFYAQRGSLTEHGWHEHGQVITVPYEPEVERFGGSEAIDLAEELFVDSSKVAIAAIRGSLAGTRRLGVAFNLFVSFARAVCDNDVVEATMLRRYVFSARFNTVDGPSIDLIGTRDQAEREFAADPDRYRGAAASVHRLVSDNSQHAGYLGFWAQRSSRYAEKLRGLDANAQLTGYGSAWTVLLSQLHMLMNRIGVTLPEEYYLSWLGSLVCTGATMGEGYHDRGMAGAGRRYHEASKYFAERLEQQLPREVASGPRSGFGQALTGRMLSLPAPTEAKLIRPLLIDSLAARRSTLGTYRGPVPVSDLSALLHYAAGQQTVKVQLPNNKSMDVPSRPFPTAGAMSPSRVLVFPTDVPGVQPAIYQYSPAEHGLREIAPAPDLDRFAACSPYFDRTGPMSMDAHSVPLWLFVTVDMSAIIERYGMRAYRFLLLEAGHLAQNLLLLATALGYSSLTVGAFYDDMLGQLLDLDGVTTAPLYAIPVGHV